MLAALLMTLGAASSGQVFVDLGVLRQYSTNSESRLISGDGSTVIVSSAYDPPGSFVQFRRFKWTPTDGGSSLGTLMTNQGPTQDLHILGISHTGAYMVGIANIVQGPANPMFNWAWSQQSGFEQTDPFHIYSAVSEDGAVRAGVYSVPYPSRHAVRWTQETGPVYLGTGPGGQDLYTDADAMTPDGSVIVGTTQTGTATYVTFRWTQAMGMVNLGANAGPTDVSDDGATVIYNTTASAFRWTQDGAVFPVPGLAPSSQTRAYEVSGNGQTIVGSSYHISTGQRATIWNEQLQPRELRSMLIDDYGIGGQLAEWQLTRATGISSDGTTIIGDGISPRGCERAWLVRLTPGPALPAPPVCADANCSGEINASDLSVLLSQFGTAIPPNSGADFNGDGVVNAADLSILLSQFGKACGW